MKVENTEMRSDINNELYTINILVLKMRHVVNKNDGKFFQRYKTFIAYFFKFYCY